MDETLHSRVILFEVLTYIYIIPLFLQIIPDTIPEGLESVDILIASITGGARTGDARIATIGIRPNDAPHGVVSIQESHFVIAEEEYNYTAMIPVKREFRNLGELQVINIL